MKIKIKEFQVSQGVKLVTIGSKAACCTIGYRRVNRMVQVAVSYCAPDDTWNGKIGRALVVGRLEYAIGNVSNQDGVISLPIGKWTEEEIQGFLQGVFLYFPTL